MTLEISEPRLGEFETLAAFSRSPGQEAPIHVGSVAELAVLLARNPAMSLVVREEGKIVGVILSGHVAGLGCVNQLSVAESHRGRGLGRALVDKAMLKLRARGIHKCHISPDATDGGEAFWDTVKWHGYRDLAHTSPVGRITRQDPMNPSRPGAPLNAGGAAAG